MWMEELVNGKYKFLSVTKDPYRKVEKSICDSLDSGSTKQKKEAPEPLDEKIAESLESLTTTDSTIGMFE